MVQRATAVWLEPVVPGAGHRDAHRVTIESGHRKVASAVLGGGLGDAVLARLALVAGLDLFAGGSPSGRCEVAVGATRLELLVTVRTTERGLAGELRVLDAAGDDAGASVATLPDGGVYPPVLTPGTVVGPYTILRVLGRGGMGVVYAAQHRLLCKEFAMKILAAEVLAEDPDSARRFVREARAAARIRHPGIVDVSDFGTLSDGRHYLVMELLAGRSLDRVIRKEGAVAPARAIALVRAVATALEAAHGAGVVHRDLTPSNIFTGIAGDELAVKLVDFGAAALPDSDVPDGPPGYVLGTPYYMAPEQVQGLATDARCDLYALGVVFYELLTGGVPFEGETPREIAVKHILEAPPVPRSPREAISDELERVVLRLLAKKPADRYQSASSLIADLDRVSTLMSRTGWRRWLPA